MNPGVFLVPAVHEIAVSTKLAISTGTAKKPHTNALTNRPSLNAGTKGIDAPDRFMPGDARPIDRKQTFHSSGIGMANPARLDANPNLIGTGIEKWLPYFREFSRLRDLDCLVCCVHSGFP